MIDLLQALPIGNAIRLFLSPPDGSTRLRLLRKTVNTFSGQNDPAAALIYDGSPQRAVLDRDKALVNGTTYYYLFYSYDGVTWTADVVSSAIPASTYSDQSVDALSLLRERLDLGLQAEVAANRLKPGQARSKIEVLTAPPLYDTVAWPVVSVHLSNESPTDRGIGEEFAVDSFDSTADQWTEAEGYLASTIIQITGWTINPDERIELRKAVRRIIVANFPVFDDAGIVLIEPQFQDMEDFTSYAAPVYMAVCNFSCKTPVSVADQVGAIDDVISTADADPH